MLVFQKYYYEHQVFLQSLEQKIEECIQQCERCYAERNYNELDLLLSNFSYFLGKPYSSNSNNIALFFYEYYRYSYLSAMSQSDFYRASYILNQAIFYYKKDPASQEQYMQFKMLSINLNLAIAWHVIGEFPGRKFDISSIETMKHEFWEIFDHKKESILLQKNFAEQSVLVKEFLDVLLLLYKIQFTKIALEKKVSDLKSAHEHTEKYIKNQLRSLLQYKPLHHEKFVDAWKKYYPIAIAENSEMFSYAERLFTARDQLKVMNNPKNLHWTGSWWPPSQRVRGVRKKR